MVTPAFFNLTKFATFYSHNSKFLAFIWFIWFLKAGLYFLPMLFWEHLLWMEYAPVQGKTCIDTLTFLNFCSRKRYSDTLQIVLYQSPDGGVATDLDHPCVVLTQSLPSPLYILSQCLSAHQSFLS